MNITKQKQTHRYRMVGCQGLWRPGNGELLFNGYRGLLLQDEKSSGDWLHNNMIVLNVS